MSLCKPRGAAGRLGRLPMWVIGIVGGIGSGKTWVAGEFGRLGAAVLDADRAGHEVLELPEVRTAIRRRFGARVVSPAGRVDRASLARIVFGPAPEGPRELEYLEKITHPLIGQLLEREIQRFEQQGFGIAVLDAPVMVKAGWDERCDTMVFVDAPREIRLARCRKRGWSEEEFQRREAAQEPLGRKRSRSDVVIDNSGSAKLTKHQIEELWYNLKARSARV